MVDIVTVVHNEINYEQSLQLEADLEKYETGYSFTRVDNRTHNSGFGRACNLGAASGESPIIGLLNPDCVIKGPFMKTVQGALASEKVVITGERYNKPQRELQFWGVKEFVCGATMFIKRDWWESVGGFDMNYVWSWEELDLIRQAESQGKVVQAVSLPIHHASPSTDTVRDAAYKTKHFNRGAKYYYKKWGQN